MYSTLFFKAIGTMPAATFTAMSPQHMITFREDEQSVLDIIVYSLLQFTRLRKIFSVYVRNCSVNHLQAVNAQASPRCFLKETMCFRLQSYRTAFTAIYILCTTIEELFASLAL